MVRPLPQHFDTTGEFAYPLGDERGPMIRSMTGFGRAEGAADGYALTIEIKSVNHRHLDIALRLPAALGSLDLDVRRRRPTRPDCGRSSPTRSGARSTI